MASPIPKDVLEILKSDDFMKQCCLCGKKPCQFHHNLLFGGKAVNEAWAILPICKEHHDQANNINMRRLLDWVILNRGTDEDLKRFSKVMNYCSRRTFLNRCFGKFSPRNLQVIFQTKQHEAFCNS